MIPRVPAAVLWDLDGTLIDSERYWISAERRMVAAHGGVWAEADGRQLVGNTLERSAEILRAAGVRDLSLDEIVDRLVAEVHRQVIEIGVPWRPGAVELLRDLHEAGIPNALVTMSYAENAHSIVEALPFPGFEAVISGDQVERGKPDPQPYQLGAQALGVTASASVAIEDSVTGLRSAVAAGACTIVVPNMVPLPDTADFLTWPTLTGRTTADVTAAWRDWSGGLPLAEARR